MSGSLKPLVVPVLLGIGMALAGRVLSLFLSRRYLPTYPHGEIVHFFLGFVAGTLGALAVPAILTTNLTAGVFLGLGATQFHTVRGQERSTLLNLDADARVPRGKVYIENLAQQFEADNFVMFGVALVTTLGAQRIGWWWGVAFGAVALLIQHTLFKPQTIGGVADVYIDPAPIQASGEPVDILLHPNGVRAAAVLRNPGQQQALKHDIHSILGSKVGADGHEREPELHVASEDGTVKIRMWPVEQDVAFMRKAVSNVPVLESIAAPLRAEARAARS